MPAATYSSTGGCLLALVRVIASGRTCRASEYVRLVSPASQNEYQIGAPILFHLTLDAGTVRKVSNVRCDDGLARIADVVAPDRFTWSNASHGRQALKAIVVTDQRAVASGVGEVEVRDPTSSIDLARDGASADVAFSTLGVHACDSMPVGNGEIALNSWAFPNGDVRLLIGKRDAFCGEVHVDRVSSPRTIGRGRNLFDPPWFKPAADNGSSPKYDTSATVHSGSPARAPSSRSGSTAIIRSSGSSCRERFRW